MSAERDYSEEMTAAGWLAGMAGWHGWLAWLAGMASRYGWLAGTLSVAAVVIASQ